MSNNFQIYKRLNLVGAILFALFSLYLMIAIPSTLSSLSYQKKDIIETFNKANNREEANAKIEQVFERIERNEQAKLRLLFASVIFSILALSALLVNFFIFRSLNKHSNLVSAIETNTQINKSE